MKAAMSIGNFYNYTPENSASVKHLLADSEGLNVINYLVCSAAITPTQTLKINKFMRQLNTEERFVAFGTVHYDNKDWELIWWI